MDSPVRKQLKRNDYLRHKMFRKINRRRKAERLLAINAPAKELRKRLRRRTFKCGKDAYSGGKDNDIVPFKQREEVIITPDVEYNAYLNTLPDNQRFTPNDAYDSYYYWQLNGKPKDFVEAYNKGMFTYDNSDGMYHANSVAFGKDGNGHFMKPKTHDTVGYELDWYNNGIITEEGGKQRQAKGKEKREWQKFKKKYELVDDPDRPNFYMYRKRSLKKPKFAPGKDDDDIIFGEVPYPLYDQYGNLLDLNTGAIGTTALPNVEVVADPEDVARGRAQRWYRDFGIEPNDATSTSLTTNHHLKQRSEEGAAKAAAWAKDHPILNNVGLGLSAIPLGVAAAPAVVGGGELAATALANPYVDAALTSMGGAHAAQSLANGEANWMTALELAPLGRLAKPLYEGVVQPSMRLFNSPLTGNWTKIGNREYRLSPNNLGTNGSPIESRSIAPQITAENTASEMPNIVRTVGNNGKIRLSLPSHTDNKPRQFVLEPAPTGDNKYYVHMRMWDDIENKIPASNVTNEEKQQLFDALYDELPEGAEILFPKSGPGYYGTRGTVAGLQRLARDPRFTPGTKGTLQYLDKDGKTVRIYEGTSFIKIPQITAENAANITPEQWNAAYRAAYERGDRAEGQRLWDLWFKQKAPNTKINVPVWSSSEETFNTFDLSHFGETDSGFFGYGHYLTPIEKYAATYHPVNRKFYVNIENPYIGSNDQYFNRIQYVKDRLARRKENVMHNLRDGKLTKFSKKLGINENTSLEDAERLVDKYIADETVKWNDKYVKYADEFEGKDGVLSWRELQGVPNNQEGIYREVVVPRGEQIKSAEPFTLADDGSLIDLTKRANFNINDIRYGLLPFLGLGTAENLNKSHYASGKDSGIHIKPENRGKFTRLKKRTGKSASWFKAHGTPAQKKMATFALNARKWKHK